MPAPRPAHSATRLPGLDGLRGIAALCVLAFHALSVNGAPPEWRGKGYLAVDFFFLLSGYVMARTYEARLNAGMGAGRFLTARYRRLWPVMAIGTLIGAPMLALELDDPTAFAVVALANLLLVPAVAGTVIYPVNSAAWSILAELAANALHGLALRRLGERALCALAAAAALPLIAIALGHGSLDLGAGSADWWAGLARALFAYTLGVALWRRWRDRPPRALPPAATFAAMPVLLLALPGLGAGGALYDLGFVMLAAPLLLAGGLAWHGDHPAARWAGAISFPLYAVNLPLLHLAHGLGLSPLTGTACALALAGLIALRSSPAPRRERSVAGA